MFDLFKYNNFVKKSMTLTNKQIINIQQAIYLAI